MRFSTTIPLASLATTTLALPFYRLNLGLVSINIPGLGGDSPSDTNNNGHNPLISINLPGSSGSSPEDNDPSLTRNELLEGDPSACPGVVFIWARGSTEKGNMGTLGPLIANLLEDKYNGDENAEGVWIQGVGNPYAATLLDNALPKGTSEVATREMARLFELARAKCPDIKIVAGGYSQGAALTANAISNPVLLTPDTRNRIHGTVLFGYTKNKQNKGQIPNYPADRLKVFCAKGDLVCTGTLVVTDAHFHYADNVKEGTEFLISKV